MRHSMHNGLAYIGRITCEFSRFHVLWPMKSKSGEEVCRCLARHAFSNFGLPKIFKSHSGLEFLSDHLLSLFKKWPGECRLVIDQLFDSKSLDFFEHSIITIQRNLATMIAKSRLDAMNFNLQVDWTELLPYLQLDLNTQESSSSESSLKTSSYELVFGIKPDFRTRQDKEIKISREQFDLFKQHERQEFKNMQRQQEIFKAELKQIQAACFNYATHSSETDCSVFLDQSSVEM